ncbi:MAG: hypothetical protein ACE37F_36365 [Nannocystaceae bacterium]|nr:hypothetical protein [bacterium]
MTPKNTTLPIAIWLLAASIPAACDPADEPPTVCEPESTGYEPGSDDDICVRYYEAMRCCGVYKDSTMTDGYDPSFSCAVQIQDDSKPQPCADLMRSVLACATPTQEHTCEMVEAYGAGLLSDPDGNAGGPPTDSSMPCFDEVTALWAAGCQPDIF